jgi:hypothetical protein
MWFAILSMTSKPEALDHEGVSPSRRRSSREIDDRIEAWPSSTKHKPFEEKPEKLPEPANQPTMTGAVSVGTSGHWIRRRGHTISFFWLFLFTVVLYLRPYEFFPGLSSFTSMAFYTGLVTLIIYAITQLGLEGNLTARPKEINLVLLLGVAAILSMPLAVDPGEAWKTFTELLLKTIVIFVVFVNVVRTELRLKLLLLLILAVSVYLSVNAINDYRLGVFLVGELETARIAGRIKGLFENSNDLALHLVTMIPIAVALGLSRAGLFRKLVFFGGAALMGGAVIVTFSRGGFLGLATSVLILVRRLGRKNRVATTGALVFAVLLFLALAPGDYSGRLSTIFNSGADITGSSSQRTEILKRSVWVALRYPLFGVGIGNFHHKSLRDLGTHNAYTQVAAEMGVGAMVVYIMFLVHPLRRLRLIENQTYSKPEHARFYYLAVGLQGSLIGFMVSSFFGAVAYQWYAYYLVGYAVCLHRLFIMKSEPQGGFAGALWERPFAKKESGKLTPAQTSQTAGLITFR